MGVSQPSSHARLLQDVTREMLQSPSQHYASLINLLRRIKDNADASGELMRWGLRLDPNIHWVRAAGGQTLICPPQNRGTGCTGGFCPV